MDEVSMVRRLLAEAPPPPRVVTAGRERLLGAPAGALPRTRTARRAALRSAFVLGLTMAASAAALVVTTLVPGLGSSPGGGGPLLADASARSVLLTAAVHAESAPTSGGTYWHVRSMSTTAVPQPFGHGENRYTLERRSLHEQWTTRTGQAWSGTREWVRPKTPQDETAWRRDGAPSTWCRGHTDTEPPTRICLRTAPGAASLTKDDFPFELAEGHELSFAQLQRLPADPDGLRAWLVGMTRHDLDPSASADIVELNVSEILVNLLVYPPVPPGVRAAAYRALADLPEVTSIGSTKDQLGRGGIGISIAEGREGSILVAGDIGPAGEVSPAVRACAAARTARRIQRRCAAGAGQITRTLIIDPGSSQVLADETSVGDRSDPVTDTLILDVGWTNEKPHKPGLP